MSQKSSEAGLRKTALIRELVDLSRFTEGILRTMGSAVVAVDPNGCIAYINPEAEELFGKTSKELFGSPAAEALGDNGELVEFGLNNPKATGEIDLDLPGGRHITVEARFSPYPVDGPDEAPGGFVAILTDLTDVRRAEAQARRKEQMASLGELSAGVAHEIRNPLAGIAASAQILRKRLEGDQRTDPLVQVILEETQRLDRIVESLLEFAKPPTPRMQQSLMSDVAERALNLVRPAAEEQGVDVQYDPQENSKIWIDPDLIQQVLLNLMQNAVQAMPQGGRLEILVHNVMRAPYVRRTRGRRSADRILPPSEQPEKVEWVEVVVKDTGSGMTKEALERAFDPFYTTKKAGTGLGLSICQSIVQEHAGVIFLDSSQGSGTTARLNLPLEKRRRSRRTG